jgi:5-methylcytosine-specific restriction endonuclease McrA
LSDAAGDHIIAHSEGGLTRMANLIVCHKDLNSKMGSTNALDFKKIYLDNLSSVDLPTMGVSNEL